MLMNMSINYYLTVTHQLADSATMKQVGQSVVLGIQTLEMGVLGGIIAGVITYFLHERFQDTVLHDAFAFFSGIRFVPIITSLTLSLVGWPFLCSGPMLQWVLLVLVHYSKYQRIRPVPLWRWCAFA